MITNINEFKNSLNEENGDFSLSFDAGPGGTAEDIMRDWNLKAKQFEDGEMTIYGTKEEVYGFADDYGLEHLLEESLNESINLKQMQMLGYDSKEEFKDRIIELAKEMQKDTGMPLADCKKIVVRTFEDELNQSKYKQNEAKIDDQEERNNLDNLLYVGDFEM
jgi:hypothetical protein